jgi:hypothetical protein
MLVRDPEPEMVETVRNFVLSLGNKLQSTLSGSGAVAWMSAIPLEST